MPTTTANTTSSRLLFSQLVSSINTVHIVVVVVSKLWDRSVLSSLVSKGVSGCLCRRCYGPAADYCKDYLVTRQWLSDSTCYGSDTVVGYCAVGTSGRQDHDTTSEPFRPRFL